VIAVSDVDFCRAATLFVGTEQAAHVWRVHSPAHARWACLALCVLFFDSIFLDRHFDQASTEINLTMKTFPYLIRLLAFCPWPTVAQTPMAVNFSSLVQKQTG
jgi:hypothetical protein